MAVDRVVVTLPVVVVVSACGGAGVLEPARSDVAFEASASTPEVEAVAASDMQFTIDLVRALADGETLFVSPIGISTMLGMVIDRPFLFFIVDDNTGAPIFAGIVEDPTAG